MRKILLALCFFISSNIYAGYVPLTVASGFNADVIANGVGTALITTTNNVDGETKCYFSNGWQQTAASAAATNGLPTSGFFNSAVTSGLNFQLGDYSANNDLRLAGTGNGTLVFQTPTAAQTFYLAAVSGGGSSNISFQINFSDGTNQTGTLTVADWYGGTNACFTGFKRMDRNTMAVDNQTTAPIGPNIYQYAITINTANINKLISSVLITRTGGSNTTSVLNVFAISVLKPLVTVPLSVASGFNADVIANGVGTAMATTNNDIDGGGKCYFSNGWQQTAASTAATTGLPATGTINSASTFALAFQMANYTGNNDLRLTGTGNGTLAFQTPQSALTFCIAAVSGNGSSNATVQINFSDGTNQSSSITVADWYGGTNTCITGFQRMDRTTMAMDNNTNPAGPNIYQYVFSIDPANQSKLIASVSITRTGGSNTTSVLNIFAASIEPLPITCAAPTSPTATNITATSAILDWTNTGTPLAYQIKYGPNGFNVNTAGTSIFTMTKPYTLNPPLTASTAYSYYVRIICAAGDTSAWSPVVNFTTLCNSPSILSKKDSFNCGPGSVTLEATATGGSLKWYAAAAGGTNLGVGNSFVTPSITATTNYFVEAVNLTSLGQVGRNDYTGISQVAPNMTGQGMRFNALTNLNLDSVSLWVTNDTGHVIVQLQNAANTALRTDTFAFSGTGATATVRKKIYLKVNYTIPTGNDYKILAMAGTTVQLSREQAINPTYSNYSIANVITMVSSWVNGATNAANYYYFYNLYVSSGCASPRQTVVASIRPIPTVNIGRDTTICPGVSYTFNAGNAGATYLWAPGGETTQTITKNAAGQYSVAATVNKCMNKDTITITPGIVPVNNLSDSANLCEGSTTTLNAGNPGSTYVWTPGGATTQTKNVNSGGTHSVVVKSVDGCKITSATYVTMRPLPVNNLGNDTSICKSASIVLDAGNTGSSYNWNTGATTQTINAMDSGTYSVTVTSPYACVNSDTKHIAFKPEAYIEGFNFIPKFYEELGKIEFTPLNPVNVNSYEWDFGDGTPLVTEMNPTHIYAASGDYDVTLKVYNECMDFSRNQVINVELSTTGTADIKSKDDNIVIYPNPAKSLLNISNKNSGTDSELQDIMIYNALGAMIYHQKADSKTMHQLSVEGFSSGVYFVRILTNKGFMNQQIQVVK